MDLIANHNLLGATLLHSGDFLTGALHFERALRGIAHILEASAKRDSGDQSGGTILTRCDGTLENENSAPAQRDNALPDVPRRECLALRWFEAPSIAAVSELSSYTAGAFVFSPDSSVCQLDIFRHSKSLFDEEVLTLWSAAILFNLALSRHVNALFHKDFHMVLVAKTLYAKVGQTLDSLMRFVGYDAVLHNSAIGLLYMSALNNQGLLALDTADYETTMTCFTKINGLCLLFSSSASSTHEDTIEPTIPLDEYGFFLLNAVCFNRTMLAAAA